MTLPHASDLRRVLHGLALTSGQAIAAESFMVGLAQFLANPTPEYLPPGMELAYDIVDADGVTGPVGLHVYSDDFTVLTAVGANVQSSGYFAHLEEPQRVVTRHVQQCNLYDDRSCLHIGNLQGLEQIPWVKAQLDEHLNYQNPDLPPIVVPGGYRPVDRRRRWGVNV